jgi:hypothetical protein
MVSWKKGKKQLGGCGEGPRMERGLDNRSARCAKLCDLSKGLNAFRCVGPRAGGD